MTLMRQFSKLNDTETVEATSASEKKTRKKKEGKSSSKKKNLLKVLKNEDQEGSEVSLSKQSKVGKTASIKKLDSMYGAQSNDLTSSKNELTRGLDILTSRAESSIESLFFTYEETDSKTSDGKEESDIVTLDTSKNELESGLTFSEGGVKGRKLSFEKDSMAL